VAKTLRVALEAVITALLLRVILVFKYILTYYKQRVKAYKAVDYNAHNKAPEDHLLINLRAA
jgi:hypothetical protein